MVTEFYWETSRKSKYFVIILFVALFATFGVILYSQIMQQIKPHTWLFTDCQISLITQLKAVTSIEDAKNTLEMAGVNPRNITNSTFQYCDGYFTLTDKKEYWFLCGDGRLYQLTSCKKMEQDETILIEIFKEVLKK